MILIPEYVSLDSPFQVIHRMSILLPLFIRKCLVAAHTM